MDRRQLLTTGLALGSGAVTAAAGAASAAIAKGAPTARQFPAGFRWGCATAAYQIEGAVNEDGRGETNWDVYSHSPGRIVDGTNGDIACDSYHRYREDTKLLKDLGAGTYRMSIAWARIFPEGRGQPNQKGIDHYSRVVDNLLENGIQPYVTLFHWDFPTALRGGWQSRDTALAFADYAGFMAGKLADRVKHFMTINEFICYTDLSYKVGKFAPGLKLPDQEVNQIRHHGVLAHGLGLQAIRAHVGRDVKVGLADNPKYCVPVIETPEHIDAARLAMRRENAPFLTAVMEGKYLDSYLEAAGASAPQVLEGDMKAIGGPVDFVGLNVYAPDYVRADHSPAGYALVPHLPTSPRMILPWLYVGPEVAYWAVRHTADLWKPRAIYISENGCAAADPLVAGRVDDVDRVMYLRNFMSQLHRAVAEKYPVEGYFLWSLMDNFEWAEGHSARFGIHYTNYETQQRIPKLSAAWYRELIARNAVV
jgi:beta-glucosidase